MPHHVKDAIRKYTTGGPIMPDDVRQELDEFTTSLNNPNISVEDKAFFERAIQSIRTKYPTIEQVEVIEEHSGIIDDLYGGNFYKNNPAKLLGISELKKDRYGKEVTIQKGNISILEAIDVQTDFGKFINNQSIGVSAIKDDVQTQIVNPAIEEFVTTIIEESNVQIGKKAVRARKKKSEPESVAARESEELPVQSYQEIYKSLNQNISSEELKAYIWYKQNIGQSLSNEWYQLAYELPDNRSDEQKLNDWVRDGVLFYFNGEYLPLPLYASGNIYEKIQRIVKTGENSGADVEFVQNTYGEAVLKKQLEVLNSAYDTIYTNRLIISGNEEGNSLILKPISKFAKSFTIESTESMPEFKWWEKGGKPNYENTTGQDYKKKTFATLSLTDAFCLWLTVNKDKLELKGNISYYDIIYFYIEKRTKQAPSYLDEVQEALWKAQLERTKSKSRSEGNRLFLEFMNTELSLNQKVTIETSWNAQYNNYLKPDYTKIPVAFNITGRFFDEEPFVVKPEKREAVSFIFNEGSGCLAYDVGVGKSLSAIMIIEQFLVAGYCKRPFLVVPNQTFKQWLSEIKNALPHRKVNGLYNLAEKFRPAITDEDGEIHMVDEGSITVLTYEGFERIGFNDQTQSQLMDSLYEILNQGGAEELTDKKKASFREKLEEIVGRGLKGTNVEIEALGLDFVCFDEAHALKKVFTSVKGEVEEGEKKARKSYDIQSGTPSATALKGFMISHYILLNNNYRNILMLTATPFTNSPLEVFSMLSLVAYHHLKKLGINNINDFFDNYIGVETELVINHKLQPVFKQVVKGFNNLPALQKIIFRFFNYKDGDDVGVVRPNKWVIPHITKLENGEVVHLPENEQVTCNIEMSGIQKQYMDDVIAYAEGKMQLGVANNLGDEEETEGAHDLGQVVDESALNKNEKAGVVALRSMNFSRNIALSPYLYEYSTLGTPTYTDYVNTSPKLKYVMECIASVKKYHEDHNEPVSGQVIYMDRGLEYFNLLKDYLVYEVGFENHEVAQITSGMNADKKRKVQDSFLGRRYNETTQEYENITDAERVKVLLGSSSIKEGINLQTKSTVLYNCFLDWNPTDLLQLQGRIWRQKNEFMNVRIVNPLVIDSIDIFMFQKLEEKTARINSIWSNNNKSVFKLEEINPEEIKMKLIKDPKVIAGLEVELKDVQIQDEINSIQTINKRLEDYLDNVKKYANWKDETNELIAEYAPNKMSDTYDSKVSYLANLFRTEYPKDGNGKVMLGWQDSQYNMAAMIKKFGENGISSLDKPSRPYWFPGVVEAKRMIEKDNKELLVPRNIQKDAIRDYIDGTDARIKKLEEEKKYLKSEDYIDKRTKEIIADREKNKFVLKSIPELIKEFERLNYLLSIKRPKKPKNKEEVHNIESILKKLYEAADLLN
jgi:hypothetical protein